MSDHDRTVIYDRRDPVPALCARLQEVLAKALDAHDGRFESVWSRDQPDRDGRGVDVI